MGKLDGRVVLVTGAARGQGEQEARLFAAEGARVVVADVLVEQGEALAKELREELGADVARFVRLDVGDEQDWAAAVASAAAAFPVRPSLPIGAGRPRHQRHRRSVAEGFHLRHHGTSALLRAHQPH